MTIEGIFAARIPVGIAAATVLIASPSTSFVAAILPLERPAPAPDGDGAITAPLVLNAATGCFGTNSEDANSTGIAATIVGAVVAVFALFADFISAGVTFSGADIAMLTFHAPAVITAGKAIFAFGSITFSVSTPVGQATARGIAVVTQALPFGSPAS